jgi:hypothetical protein
MATPGEKLAESLEILKQLQESGIVAINTSMISRVHRERLLTNNYIREVTKGWYIAIPPEEKEGDSTSWYTSYWSFCAGYLKERYGDGYCISAEQSLQIHAGDWSVPNQLVIRSTDGPNGITALPFNTSLVTIKSPLPNAAEIIEFEGIRMLSPGSSLIHCSPQMFTKYPIDVRTVLAMIRDSSDILGFLLEDGRSTKAGQLAGAFRNNSQEAIADQIINAMHKAGYSIRETNLFQSSQPIVIDIKTISPYVNRLKLMWHQMRDIVIKLFPPAPGLPKDQEQYLKLIEEIYVTDAYHSLSIEKYNVSAELIERVRSGEWNIIKNDEDRKQRDAMAARGYWQATQKVIESIKKILSDENPGIVVEKDHRDWYLELFAPGVAANILKPADLAGYRNAQVYIGQSRHVPLNVTGVRDAMPVLFELLKQESEASVRAVLGHFIFVYIHPYMDGNGRMARFLMNVMLASGGYPWTVIPVEERRRYMLSLEKASVNQDIESFAGYIAYLVKEGLKGTPVASIKTI